MRLISYSIQTSTLDTNVPFPSLGGQLGCISGYIANPNATLSASVIIYGVNRTGKVTRSIAPNGYLIFRMLEFEQIINLAAFSLEIVYSENTNFLLEESQSIVNIGTTVDINISSISGSVTIPISGSVDITNTSIAVTGTVSIGNTANINISSITGGVTIPISGSVDITNTSIAVTGTVNIGNNITIAGNVNSLTIDVTSSITLPTDTGTYSQNLQENQTNGQNVLTYNPWGFSTSVLPAVRTFGATNTMANVQANGARGYLTFYFMIYNGSSASASATITVNLYDRLPSNGFSSSPINSFSFTTPTIGSGLGSAVWQTVTPNIFWNYNTMVVIPSAVGGAGSNAVTIAMPSSANDIDSHYFTGTYWNSADYGFIGYWTLTDTAPASLPVSVVSPISVSEGEPNSVISTTSGNALIGTVPNGKKWKILRTYCEGTSNGTAPLQVSVYLFPSGEKLIFQGDLFENLAYINQSSVTLNTQYYGYGSVVGGSNLTFGITTQAQTWSNFPILYAGDKIYSQSNNDNAVTVQIWYIESDV